MRKAYGYQRVSSTGQADGHGFDRQQEAIEAWARANGYQMVEWFRETVTGTAGKEERPAFSQMVAAILKNGVSTVIVERLDRLAREYRVQENMSVYLASKGITLISADTGEDITQAIQDDPMRKALVQMQGVFAELDKSMLVKKLRLARERKKAETGRCGGRYPYGHTPEEIHVIGLVKGLRRKPRGHGAPMAYSRIARKLNEAGYRLRNGNLWTAEQVRRVTQGPFWTKARVAALEE